MLDFEDPVLWMLFVDDPLATKIGLERPIVLVFVLEHSMAEALGLGGSIFGAFDPEDSMFAMPVLDPSRFGMLELEHSKYVLPGLEDFPATQYNESSLVVAAARVDLKTMEARSMESLVAALSFLAAPVSLAAVLVPAD